MCGLGQCLWSRVFHKTKNCHPGLQSLLDFGGTTSKLTLMAIGSVQFLAGIGQRLCEQFRTM